MGQYIKCKFNRIFLCAKEAAKEMVKRKQGVIIDINSKSGKKEVCITVLILHQNLEL